MSEMVRIRSIRDYFQEFGVDGIGKGANVEIVKSQLMDAFRKEMFDQIMFQLKADDISEIEENRETSPVIHNIMRNTYKKWLGLIREFNKYRETRNLLFPDDLKLTLEDEDDEEPEDETEEDDDGGMAEETDGEGQDPDESADTADEADAR